MNTPSPSVTNDVTGIPPTEIEFNSNRMLVSILREICRRRAIEFTGFSDDWVLVLQKGGKVSRVMGYDFELNSATAKMICRDKSATSDLLAFTGVPRVEHRLFHGPQLKGYVSLQGNWRPMLEFFAACGNDVVCKPNEGTGGKGVTRARTEAELEAAVLDVFTKSRSLCLSPFELIEGEYRVAIVSGEVHFVYRKERPALVGDGKRSVRELLLERMLTARNFPAEVDSATQLIEGSTNLDRIAAAGEQVVLNWRHNLGGGAAPRVFDRNAPEIRPIIALACHAIDALGVTVASVDVVATPGGLKVLEVNSGIMMENLARHSSYGYDLAYRFYDRIVCHALGVSDSVP
jgi:glutathione synthase/RimK-type ligase-like ATP-grasp enzyme